MACDKCGGDTKEFKIFTVGVGRSIHTKVACLDCCSEIEQRTECVTQLIKTLEDQKRGFIKHFFNIDGGYKLEAQTKKNNQEDANTETHKDKESGTGLRLRP